MNKDLHQRAKRIFLEIVRSPGDDREKLLARLCADDSDLRSAVEVLLQHHQETSDAAGAATIAVGGGASLGDRGGKEAPEEDSVGQRVPVRTASSAELQTGEVFGDRFRIVSMLGKGGMGSVWRAEDLLLGEPVALKLIHDRFSASPIWVARLSRETRVARTISHPNVCRVHDIGTHAGRFFISMEYIDGEDLASLLRRIGRIPVEKAADVARQICLGLHAAHRAGIVHRDLKPANVMLDGRGLVKLTDFGLADLPDRVSTAEIRSGTPAYMAPEQIGGRGVSLRSDVYALGLIIYEIYSGRVAAQGQSLEELIEFHEKLDPQPLSAVLPDVPYAVDRMVRRCLAKSPGDRPASALEVAAALPGTDVLSIAVQGGETPSPSLVAAAEAKSIRRGNLWRWVLATCFLLGTTCAMRSIGGVSWSNPGPNPPRVLAERARQIMEAASLSTAADECRFGYASAETVVEAATRIADCGREETITFVLAHSVPYFWRACGAPPLPSSPPNPRFLSQGRDELETLSVSPRLRTLLAFDPEMRTAAFASDELLRKNDGSSSATDTIRALLAEFGTTDGIETARPSTEGTSEVRHWSATVTMGETASRARGLLVNDWPRLGTLAPPEPGESYTWFDDALRRTTVTTWRRLLYFVVAIGALPWALRSLRTGQVDRDGTRRVAALAFGTQMFASLLRLRAVGTFDEWTYALVFSLLTALGVGVLLACCFAAVEPLARRTWPDTLITWNRLFKGRLHDPEVRAHAVLGIGFGALWGLLPTLERTVVAATGLTERTALFGARFTERLWGVRPAIAGYLESIPDVMFLSVLLLLLVVAIQRVTGSRRAAAVLAAVLLLPLATPQGAHMATSWLVLGIGVVALAVWLMVRYGLLVVAIALFTMGAINLTPLTIDPSSWYFDTSLCVVLATVGSMLYLLLHLPPRKSATPLPDSGA